MQEAEANLQIKGVIVDTHTRNSNLGDTLHRWFSHEDSRGHRDVVITELSMIEEEKKAANADGKANQCAWMNWEGA